MANRPLAVALIACVILLVAILGLLRLRARRVLGVSGSVKPPVWVRQCVALSPQVRLVVLDYAGRQLLVAVGPQGAQCLRDDPAPMEPSR